PAPALLRDHASRPRAARRGARDVGRLLERAGESALNRGGGDRLTAAAHVPSDVERYLARVRDALSDLPVEERNELLAEVEASLYESASETGGPVAAQLGPPEDFAAELR